jgi:hypothetical protein
MVPSESAERLIAVQISTIVRSGQVHIAVILPPTRTLLTYTPPTKTGITLRTNCHPITHRNTIGNRGPNMNSYADDLMSNAAGIVSWCL